MSVPNRVLLLTLSERTSAKGRRYMSGRLGKASVVAFEAEEPDRYGNATWDLFVSTPEPRGEGRGDQPYGKVDGAPPDKPCGHKVNAPREGYAGGARQRGDGWKDPSAYRRPRAGSRRTRRAVRR